MLNHRARVVLDTLLPDQSHPTLSLGIFRAGFDDFYRRFQAEAPPAMKRVFPLSLFVAIWLAPLLIWQVPPISRLDRPTRERALAALYASRFTLLRQLFFMLKATVCFCYGTHPEVRAAIGYGRQPQPSPLPIRVGE